MAKQNCMKDKVYNFLVAFTEANGYQPSIREICRGVGLKSTSTVHAHLTSLHIEGKIEIKDKSSRAIKIVGYKFVKDDTDR